MESISEVNDDDGRIDTGEFDKLIQDKDMFKAWISGAAAGGMGEERRMGFDALYPAGVTPPEGHGWRDWIQMAHELNEERKMSGRGEGDPGFDEFWKKQKAKWEKSKEKMGNHYSCFQNRQHCKCGSLHYNPQR